MKVRTPYIILLLFVIYTDAFSQHADEKYYRWNIGISTGDILHQLFNSDNTNKSYAALVLEYTGPKYSLQAGFRPGYNKIDTEHEGFVDSEITDQLSLSGHLALTKHILTDPRWMIKAGLRYEGGWSREDIIEDSGFDRITTRRLQWNAGLGPVLDFRFFVHPRISLGTDAALLYAYGQSEVQQLFTNFPDFDTTKDTVIERKLHFLEPMTIYLRYHL